MMTQQQQQILVRSALAAGLTLAVGLVAVGFAAGHVTGGGPSPAATGASAVPPADQAVLQSDVTQGAPAVAIAGEAAAPREFALALDQEDDDDDERDEREDDDEDEDEGHEREGAREAFRAASEQREHR